MDIEKVLVVAKSLGVKVLENSDKPAFVVNTNTGYQPLDVREMLKTCSRHSEDELFAILENQWSCENQYVKFAKPLKISGGVGGFRSNTRALKIVGYQDVSVTAV